MIENKLEANSFIPSKLIMGILSTEKEISKELKAILEEKFGPFELLGDAVIFDFTDYYEKEMGFPIYRSFLAFDNLVNPELLASYKLTTIEIEQEFKDGESRTINLDPGLLTTASIILATTKNRSHRIPLEKGIYAELTLIFSKGFYQDFEWTYPDYKSDQFKDLFYQVRQDYLKQLKAKNLI